MRFDVGVIRTGALVLLAAVAGVGGGALVASRDNGGTTTVVRGAAAPATVTGSALPPNLPAVGLQERYVQVVQQVSPSVVQIDAGSSLGSGVVFDRKGNIVTNAHVVEGGETQLRVTLANGKSFPATLVGSFPTSDLAVVHVDANDLTPLPLARSSRVRVGDIVLAVGSPLGLQASVTDGIISAVGRTVAEPTGTAIPEAIQTSAPINPGNSGGALVDLAGRLVGVPTLAANDPSAGTRAPGIGFAIPSDTVREIATQLVKFGKVVSSGRAFLGIQIASTVGGGGVYVGSVTAGGPAAKAGIRAADIITSVDGHRVESASDLSTVLAPLRPGKVVDVTVVREDGSEDTVKVTLGEFPGTR